MAIHKPINGEQVNLDKLRCRFQEKQESVSKTERVYMMVLLERKKNTENLTEEEIRLEGELRKKRRNKILALVLIGALGTAMGGLAINNCQNRDIEVEQITPKGKVENTPKKLAIR